MIILITQKCDVNYLCLKLYSLTLLSYKNRNVSISVDEAFDELRTVARSVMHMYCSPASRVMASAEANFSNVLSSIAPISVFETLAFA